MKLKKYQIIQIFIIAVFLILLVFMLNSCSGQRYATASDRLRTPYNCNVR